MLAGWPLAQIRRSSPVAAPISTNTATVDGTRVPRHLPLGEPGSWQNLVASRRILLLVAARSAPPSHLLDAVARPPQTERAPADRKTDAAALDLARRQGAPIIVAKLDRLSRDVHFISGLMKHRVRS
jgi:hypothetical protein